MISLEPNIQTSSAAGSGVWTDDIAELIWTLEYTEDAYIGFSSVAVNGDYIICKYTFNLEGTSHILSLKRTKGSPDTFEATIDGTAVASTGTAELYKYTRDVIRQKILDGGGESKSFYPGFSFSREGYKSAGTRDDDVCASDSPGEGYVCGVYFDLYQVTASAYDQDGTAITATFDGAGKWYFPGETPSPIKITTPPNTSNYEYVKWTVGKDSSFSDPGSDRGDIDGFTVPNGVPTASDFKYVCKVWYRDKIAFPYDVSVSVSPTGSGTATASPTFGKTGTEITLTATANAGYTFQEWEVLSGGVTIVDSTKDTATFSIKNANVSIRAIFKTSTGGVNGPVKVTKNLSVPLSNYTDGDPTIGNITKKVNTNYVSVTPSSGKASIINITGITPVSTATSGLTVDGKDVDVIVYNLPTLKTSSYKDKDSSPVLEGTMPKSVYHDNVKTDSITGYVIKYNTKTGEVLDLDSNGNFAVDVKRFTKDIADVMGDDSEKNITMTAHPVFYYQNKEYWDPNVSSDPIAKKVYKIKLNGDEGAKYKINDKEMEGYFYAIAGIEYKIEAMAKSSEYKETPDRWEGVSFGDKRSGTTDFDSTSSKTITAFFSKKNSSSSSSSSSSSGRQSGANGESMGDGYDDVPKTGESKTDIWILWTVLFISILGAGFLIWKRFGLARAIAEADEAVAHAEYEEQVKAAEKEKQEKLDMLKDLRNL